MNKRIQMKSENLQKYFSETYENFFLENNLIVSIPNIIHRGYIFDKKNISPQIKQKIPSKMFMGINIKHDSDEIVLKNISYLSVPQRKFITKPLEEIFADINTKYLEQSIKEKLSELGYTKGIEINILSENERGTGIEFCSIIGVLITFIIYLVSGKTTKEDISTYTTFLSSPTYTEIYKTTISLLKKSEFDTSGTTTFTALSNNRAPVSSIENTDKIKKKIHKDNASIWDIFNIQETHNQPMIDYGILSFGSSYDEYYTKHGSKIEKSENEIASYLNKKLLNAWGDIIKYPYNEIIIEDFIGMIIEQGIFGTFIEKDNKLFADIIFLFSQVKEFQDEKIGIMPLTSGKYGGSFLFVTKYKKSRETMEKLLTKLQENGHQAANYSYLSRIDGFTNEGVKVEQYISQNLFSSYIKKDCINLEELGGETIIGSYKDILAKTDGIIFDTINKKVCIQGENITHKDLFTQSATVEIIEALFKNEGYYIKNNELPVSNYSKNKNNMIGKILLPLQQLIKKRFNSKLDLKCSGDINNFDLILNKGNIPIHIIKKIV